MGHGFGMTDNVFAAHFGEAFLYGVDMLGPHPGETLEPTLEGAKVLQVSGSRCLRAGVFFPPACKCFPSRSQKHILFLSWFDEPF